MFMSAVIVYRAIVTDFEDPCTKLARLQSNTQTPNLTLYCVSLGSLPNGCLSLWQSIFMIESGQRGDCWGHSDTLTKGYIGKSRGFL